ncbi:hypothetical protein BH10ACT11_BH10ACT11_11100 [soil metagenome]
MRRAAAFACLALAAALAAGCQSTHETSKIREANGSKLFNKAKGLKITNVNQDIKVLDTAVLSDANGTAVAVTVKNESKEGFAKLPILIDVRDAKGKSVFKNDIPGLEPSLTSIPTIGAGQTVTWVNDQILGTGKAKSVKVKIGEAQAPLPQKLPAVKIDPPKLVNDSVSGTEATGEVENETGIDQKKLVLFAVGVKDGKIVAAGRGGFKRLNADRPKPAVYHIYFIGDPKGSKVTVTAPPSTLN